MIFNISIHAPLRERQKWSAFVLFKIKFQSTLPCGSDTVVLSASLRPLLFQSTLPCGSDWQVLFQRHPVTRFQSTLPCGSDDNLPCHFVTAGRFQSTLPCGSDSITRRGNAESSNFNPRSLAGATQPDTAAQQQQTISIHAPLRERRTFENECIIS